MSSSISSTWDTPQTDSHPPSLRGIHSQATQEAVKPFLEQSPAEIATEIESFVTEKQALVFFGLPRTKAVAVYSLLDTNIQQNLIEAFKNRPDTDFTPSLSPQERVQLFEWLYSVPVNHADVEESTGSALAVVKRRSIWLFVLLLTNTLTAAVIGSQEEVLQQVVILAIFIPLLVASGGNVSTQASTVVVRGLHIKGASWKYLIQVMGRELIAGLLLGIMLGLAVAVEAMFFQSDPIIAAIVGVSLFIITTIATLCGSILPFIFQALGFDPALMSAPLGATLVDVAGLLIYLQIARFVLHI